MMLQQEKPDDYVLATGEGAFGARVHRAGFRGLVGLSNGVVAA